MFSDQNTMKWEVNNKEIWESHTNVDTKQHQHILKQPMHQIRNHKKNFKYFEINEMRTQRPKIIGQNQSRM